MRMKLSRITVFGLWLVTALTTWAAEVIPALTVNGVRYESVKIGPINAGKVLLFHSRGVTSVPVNSLPAEYRPRVEAPATVPANDFLPVPGELDPANGETSRLPAPGGSATPKTNTPDPAAILEAMRTQREANRPSSGSQATGDWAVYNRERLTRLVLDGQLVDRSTLKPIVGFLVKERTRLREGGRDYFGAAMDLAVRKANTDSVAGAMDLRPSLWERTDERVFLVNYHPTSLPGAVIRVYATEITPVEGWRTFKVGTEPSFEEWKRLTGRW